MSQLLESLKKAALEKKKRDALKQHEGPDVESDNSELEAHENENSDYVKDTPATPELSIVQYDDEPSPPSDPLYSDEVEDYLPIDEEVFNQNDLPQPELEFDDKAEEVDHTSQEELSDHSIEYSHEAQQQEPKERLENEEELKEHLSSDALPQDPSGEKEAFIDDESEEEVHESPSAANLESEHEQTKEPDNGHQSGSQRRSAIPSPEELLKDVLSGMDDPTPSVSEKTENKLKESIAELVSTTENEEKRRHKIRIIGFWSFIAVSAIALVAFYLVIKVNIDSTDILVEPMDSNLDTSAVQEIYENSYRSDSGPAQGHPEAVAVDQSADPKQEQTSEQNGVKTQQQEVETKVVPKPLAENSRSEISQSAASDPAKQNTKPVRGELQEPPKGAGLEPVAAVKSRPVVPPKVKTQESQIKQKTLKAVDRSQPKKGAIHISVNSEREKIRQAYDLFHAGELKAALEIYKQLLETTPDLIDAHLGIASVSYQMGEYGNALREYSYVLEQEPGNRNAREGILAVNAVQSNDDKILFEVETLLQRYPEAPHLHFLKGLQFAKTEAWKAANQAFYKAYVLEPKRSDYAHNLAVSFDQLGYAQQALKYYKETLMLGQAALSSEQRDQILLRIAQMEN